MQSCGIPTPLKWRERVPTNMHSEQSSRVNHRALEHVRKVSRHEKHFIVFLAFLLFILLLSALIGDTGTNDLINWVGPILLLIGCLVTGFRLAKANSVNLLLPYTWFLVATAAFFGFGPLLYNFGSSNTILRVQSAWKLQGSDLFWVNFNNILGVFVVSLSYYILVGIKKRDFGRVQITAKQVFSEKKLVFGMLLLGGLVKYTLVLPYEFGFRATLPGSVLAAASLMKLVLFLLGYMAARYRGKWIYILVAVAVIELTVDVLRLSKTEVLTTLFMPALGAFYYSRRTRLLVIAGLCTSIVYFLLYPMVVGGRGEISKLYGNHYNATLSQRADILTSGALEKSTGYNDSDQGWWRRLNYAHVQAFVMNEYRSGRPGDSYKNILSVFVPRILWRGKPIMSNISIDFTELFSGHRGSATGLGVFAEAFWVGGWFMVLAISSAVGAIFAVVTRLLYSHLIVREFLFLPAAFLGIKIGTKVTGYFVTGYLGAVVIFLAYFLIIKMVTGRR